LPLFMQLLVLSASTSRSMLVAFVLVISPMHAVCLSTIAFLARAAHVDPPRASLRLSQLGQDTFEPLPSGRASGLLFQDWKKAVTTRAEKEREMLESNTREMQVPKRTRRRGGKRSSGSGGGFGKQAARPFRTAAQQAVEISAETIADQGVCLVPSVLDANATAQLRACIVDEMERAYAAVESDPACCHDRFNVPLETLDPTRGYLLLPFRDEESVIAGNAKGTLVGTLDKLLAPGAPLGEIFCETCGGVDAELYDFNALRTEPGASRQTIHSDTPYQSIPGLFCAFIALQDVSYSMGTTVFIPGTHKQTAQRRSFDEGQYDGRREEMLSSAQSRFSLLKAGDAVVFNMNTLHAGTANFVAEQGGSQRLILELTFRNMRAREPLGHPGIMRHKYKNRGITLADMRRELSSNNPFAGNYEGDGRPFGSGMSAHE